jgi:hypothetical protein
MATPSTLKKKLGKEMSDKKSSTLKPVKKASIEAKKEIDISSVVSEEDFNMFNEHDVEYGEKYGHPYVTLSWGEGRFSNLSFGIKKAKFLLVQLETPSGRATLREELVRFLRAHDTKNKPTKVKK